MKSFDETLSGRGIELRRRALRTLQVNVGRKCNQACRHCHVDAAPWRTEMMDGPTFDRIAAWIVQHRPGVLDITGGAPELSEFFCPLVEVGRSIGATVIDRNNLTILEERGFEWLPEYLAKHGVEVVASLPCYTSGNVDRQRGNGVFEKSIRGLKKLNAVGYGAHLTLNLVYNPLGAKLPGPQAELEADYKLELESNFGIQFNNLFAITNQPIARFAEDLQRQGKLAEYMSLLVESFNPSTVEGLMCRDTLSVDYRGRLYDCDFNQMLEIDLAKSGGKFLWDVNPGELTGGTIQTGSHCFACTAGAGSSCTGATAPPALEVAV